MERGVAGLVDRDGLRPRSTTAVRATNGPDSRLPANLSISPSSQLTVNLQQQLLQRNQPVSNAPTIASITQLGKFCVLGACLDAEVAGW